MTTSNSAADRRVVITGVGVLSPLGIGAETFWQNLRAGHSGIAPIRLMSHSAAPQNIGGEIRDFDEQSAKKTYLKPLRKSLKVMCREIQLGTASAALALEHAGFAVGDKGLEPGQLNHERLGVDFGANLMFSPPEVLQDPCSKCVDDDDPQHAFHYERWGPEGENAGATSGMGSMEPLWLLRYLPNMPACHIGIFADARGPSNSLTLDEASGNLSIAEAWRIVRRDKADVMIAGTTGTRLHPVKTLHAALWDELAESDEPPQCWCRPFDQRRTGQVVAEGACSLILEEESHARNRGAQILGRVRGAGAACVVSRDGRPQPRKALAAAMRKALGDAGLTPGDIGHINAHGLGGRRADIEEAIAIHEVFGPHAATVPVTALKSALGNSGSGCGTLELAGSLLALQEALIPVTLNYETPDPECPLTIIHGEPRRTDNPIVLSINVTRMGQASALIVEAGA
ncbi:MAG: beta-ketoacyl-[acyl-carrier-protein] synthase family protein [Planctomycetes bacterium]|nr:beta-ketoacyl-[acyl-carrier-protein] synthase family protein [Planctomycetota bacterium]